VVLRHLDGVDVGDLIGTVHLLLGRHRELLSLRSTRKLGSFVARRFGGHGELRTDGCTGWSSCIGWPPGCQTMEAHGSGLHKVRTLGHSARAAPLRLRGRKRSELPECSSPVTLGRQWLGSPPCPPAGPAPAPGPPAPLRTSGVPSSSAAAPSPPSCASGLAPAIPGVPPR